MHLSEEHRLLAEDLIAGISELSPHYTVAIVRIAKEVVRYETWRG